MKLTELWGKSVRLGDAELIRRQKENREYLLSLKSDNLLLNYRLEACLVSFNERPEDIHGGWESQTCQLRGHFPGHWLSAAAMLYHSTGDAELKARADAVVDELAVCQRANGGEWAAPIPEKYLHRIARGEWVWAPQYTVHKTFMGLLDMYIYAGNKSALGIAECFANWFYRWSGEFTRESFDDILDVETGGMLEIWAQLHGLTGDEKYRTLMERYYRGRLFDGLLAGEDALTNMHANTTIPEILGAARAYESTGEAKWLDIVKAYWSCAVTERGCYATGGQTCGEVWTPRHSMAGRLGDKNQEHCTVYNMMRLASFLFTQTGDSQYADYYERGLYNGVMAQGYWRARRTNGQKLDCPEDGLISYFLPLRAGSRKGWGGRTNDFFCCHGTLVQANAALGRGVYYRSEDGVYVCQYFDSEAETLLNGERVRLVQRIDTLTGSYHNAGNRTAGQAIFGDTLNIPHDPNTFRSVIEVKAARDVEFELSLRIPWWAKPPHRLTVNGQEIDAAAENGFIRTRRVWADGDRLCLELQREITCCPLPGSDMLAFMNGPVVLAGLCGEERTLDAGGRAPEKILTPDNEREWAVWTQDFKTSGQDVGIRFIPLYRVGYEQYTVYFPIKNSGY